MGKERTKPSGKDGSVSALETQAKEEIRGSQAERGKAQADRESAGLNRTHSCAIYIKTLSLLTCAFQFVHTHAALRESSQSIMLNDHLL